MIMQKASDLKHLILGATLAASGLTAIAAVNLTSFAPGTPIKSAEINANFSSLKANLEALEAPVGVSRLAVTGTVADGKVLKLSSGNLVWGDDLVGTGGSAFTADGTSLALAGTTFFVKDAGIGTTKIADNAVTAAKIADRGISAGKLALPLNLSGGFGNEAVFKSVDTSSLGGFGVWGESRISTGVYGLSGNPGLDRIGFDGAGVTGVGQKAGVIGGSGPGIGVFGFSVGNSGVEGKSVNGTGVLGVGGAGGYAAEFDGGKFGNGICYFAGGSGWSCTSDRNAKENFQPVDAQVVLEAVARMPVTRWTMKGDKSRTPHMGPVAQDFRAAFGLGESDKTINTSDAQGVALAAIKGLYAVVKDRDTKIAALEARLLALEKAVRSR
jgi:Chaperone of endosialidase